MTKQKAKAKSECNYRQIPQSLQLHAQKVRKNTCRYTPAKDIINIKKKTINVMQKLKNSERMHCIGIAPFEWEAIVVKPNGVKSMGKHAAELRLYK